MNLYQQKKQWRPKGYGEICKNKNETERRLRQRLLDERTVRRVTKEKKHAQTKKKKNVD